jgi:hypothetical protein
MIGALNYNERKVDAGTARCILAGLFGCEASELSYRDKLGRLRDQSNLNRRSKTNVLHISLNFDPSEKLSEKTLTQIVLSYMDKIGFGDQPYLVYEHFDASHPHVHILTTSIKADGKRIPLHNLGRNKSEQARKEIETEFNLIRAAGRKHQSSLIHPADISKVKYGKDETRKGIAEVVNAVTRSYRFASIAELNAVLKQYNVQVIQGKEGSEMRKRNGLLFGLIDRNEKPVGIPIKASALPGKPIYTRLAKQFELNRTLRMAHKQVLIDRIDKVLNGKPNDFKEFVRRLSKDEVYVDARKSAEGQIFGLTYIDNNTRCVFNGSDLGKAFSAKAILDQFPSKASVESGDLPTFRNYRDSSDHSDKSTGSALKEMLGELVHIETDGPQSDPSLTKKRKRRKKRKF